MTESSKSSQSSSQPPKGRKMAPVAATSEGQPQLDVDALKEVLDSHNEEGQEQAETNAQAVEQNQPKGDQSQPNASEENQPKASDK